MAWAGGYRAPKKARGYGYQFQKLRKALLPSAYGTPCVRCGEPMLKGRAAARKARAIQLYRQKRAKTDAHRW
jgi:hypothetical protein